MFWDGGLYVDADDDQCYTCSFFNQGIMCPLIEALHEGVAYLIDEGTTVSNCGFYVKHERHLRVVE